MQPTPQPAQMPTVPTVHTQVAAPAAAPATKSNEGMTVIYQVAGEEVKLTAKAVKEILLNGDGTLTEQEISRFIALCKFNHLNPFLGEAYVIKFANNRGGEASAQMVVSKEAYFKRAERAANYDGIQAGVIIQRGEEIREEEGCFVPAGWTLVGGWAKVYRSDRKCPIVAKVNLEEYDKKQSIWNLKKATMISKIAKVQALREAFADELGGMYIAEEKDEAPINNAPSPANTKASNIFAQAFGSTATKKVEEATAEVVNEPAKPANEPADLFNQQ